MGNRPARGKTLAQVFAAEDARTARTARHTLCGLPLTWRAVLDDFMQPALLPWCVECGRPAPRSEIDGQLLDIPMDDVALADCVALTRAATPPTRIQ